MWICRPFKPDLGLVVTNVAEDEAPLWDGAISYDLGDEVIRDHAIYVSVIAANLGNDPLAENQEILGVKWLLKGATNAMSCFDGILSNATVADGPLVVEIAGLSGVDGAVLFGLVGIRATIEGFDLAGNAMFSQSHILGGREVDNWLEWRDAPFEPYSDKVAALDLPAALYRLKVTIEGGQVRLGEIFLGASLNIGRALHEGTAGQAVSSSKYAFNEFGRLSLAVRPTRNEMSYRVETTAARFRQIKPLLDRAAGSIVAAIGSMSRPTTIHLGVLDAVAWSEDLPDAYLYSFTLRGVI